MYNEAMATLGVQGADYQFYGEDVEKHMRSDLHRILRKMDIILAQQMSEFIKASIADWKSFFLSFSAHPENPQLLIPPSPLLILEVRVVKGHVCLYPDPPT